MRRLERAPRWLDRLAQIGVAPTDAEDLRVRKAVLTLSSALMASLAVVWVATYAALGLWSSAAIPLVYQLASVASVVTFAKTRRYKLFIHSQLWMTLVLPFALQWSLGGFQRSAAVCLWGFTAPLGALMIEGPRPALPWFGGFCGLVALSAAIDPVLTSHAPSVPGAVVITFFALNVLGVATTAYALLQYFVRARDAAHARSERLLLNVLPEPVATRLKTDESLIADTCPAASVLFADIVGFTPLAERLSANEVVALLDWIFTRWDRLAAQFGAEKIKTIGDAYMVASGIPLARDDHAVVAAELALAMGPEVDAVSAETGHSLQVRIGIDSGPAVAGVIGRSKFIYDLWGDTVNTASRMESHTSPGTIQVTERTYELLRNRYAFSAQGKIEVKGKGPMSTYLLSGRRSDIAYEGTATPSYIAPKAFGSPAL